MLALLPRIFRCSRRVFRTSGSLNVREKVSRHEQGLTFPVTVEWYAVRGPAVVTAAK